MLDVAGLVPGASEGRGLGNKFLDDLRHAHVLLHIIDVSGRTNEKGEETQGYDPLRDIEWLQDEIHSWIFNNLWKKWGSIVRRHVATSKSTDLVYFTVYQSHLQARR
jgi:ribosome-binding ATPase YchF (GTP1/OBG family)